MAVDLLIAPTILRVNIKASKTDPFCRGTLIHIGRDKYPQALCGVAAVISGALICDCTTSMACFALLIFADHFAVKADN